MTDEERQKLSDLSWRYAALAGIIRGEEHFAKDILKQDRERWGDHIKTLEGQPLFDYEDAVGFMVQISGLPARDCKKVLLFEWPTEACNVCGAPSQTITSDAADENEKHRISLKCVSCDNPETRIVDCEGEGCQFCLQNE
jgi:hypothetical protein